MLIFRLFCSASLAIFSISFMAYNDPDLKEQMSTLLGAMPEFPFESRAMPPLKPLPPARDRVLVLGPAPSRTAKEQEELPVYRSRTYYSIKHVDIWPPAWAEGFEEEVEEWQKNARWRKKATSILRQLKDQRRRTRILDGFFSILRRNHFASIQLALSVVVFGLKLAVPFSHWFRLVPALIAFVCDVSRGRL